MTVALIHVRHVLPDGFAELCSEARAESYRHMDRLAADWQSGAIRFDAPGEGLLAAMAPDGLAGIGGITRDPADPTALRMRRFYVRMAWRRQGIGRRIAEALMTKAGSKSRLVVNSGTAESDRFWEALGFVADRHNGHTHVSHSRDG